MSKGTASTVGIKMVYVDLLLDNGQIVHIECIEECEEDFYTSLTNAMLTGNWWSAAQFEPCSATYIGTRIDRVAMKRVVGWL